MKKTLLLLVIIVSTSLAEAASLPKVKSYIRVKQPGNESVLYELPASAASDMPVVVKENMVASTDMAATAVYEVTLTAKNRTVYVNFGAEMETDFNSADCEYYLPGFWYHKNLRSPREAPSFHTSQ